MSFLPEKRAPGVYQVWIADLCITFRTERDAQRFCNASRYAIKKSWEDDPAHD